jgi:putative colanic acid biosynthesis acetyltransferase WcaF
VNEPLDARVSRPVDGGASYPVSHRLIRVLWTAVWTLGASWTPPFMHGWRRLLLVWFGATVAPDAHVYGSARIWYPANLSMGKLSALGPGVDCYTMAPIEIGDYAIISQGAHLCAGTHDIDDPAMQLVARPITIGAYAWVAAGAFVGPGACLGEGTVLGARAVAIGKALLPWTVYVGNPAKAIRGRARRGAASPDWDSNDKHFG